MKSPITGKPMKQMVDEQRAISYNGQDVTFRFHYWLCEDTNNTFTSDSYDEINLSNIKKTLNTEDK